jgi:hypothetical protein
MIFLSHRFPYPTKVSSEKNVTYLELSAYLGQKKPVAQKYLFIAILCVEMSRVNKALEEAGEQAKISSSLKPPYHVQV